MPEQETPLLKIERNLGDLNSKLKLANFKLAKHIGFILGLDGNAQRKTREIMLQATQYGTIYTDVAWLGALLKAGADPEIISRAWELKDETARNMKTNSADSQLP